jgi:hypothetical protein
LNVTLSQLCHHTRSQAIANASTLSRRIRNGILPFSHAFRSQKAWTWILHRRDFHQESTTLHKADYDVFFVVAAFDHIALSQEEPIEILVDRRNAFLRLSL